MSVAGPSHTFLFADLVGFTALAAAEGDDRAAEVAVELRERVRRLLPGHRAEEVKAIGDGLMLRCDDPGHAVRLGARIVRELERVGLPPVRVGVHSGPAVNRSGDWYGTTVNVAARLCAAASGGEVLVSDATLKAAGEVPRVRLGESRLHWLKNIVEPVSARVVYEKDCLEGRLKALLRARPQEALP
jgi:adenylate cyclase